ncbi:hypothetical protein Tco_1122797 [Tanacetum coccineum]|uniref:Uncharacterized protein n=1 Tax=Tanacetum coccineum TaxID=301880 RepID=A0ABQ5J1J7_9ASTR
MKRGFRGVPRPLLPAMLPVVVVDQSAGQADQAVDQPSPSEPLPSSSHPLPTPHPKSPSPEPDSEPIEHTFEQPSPEHQPLSPRQETEVPQSQDPTHPHVAEERTMILVVLPIQRIGCWKVSSKPGEEFTRGRYNTAFEEVNTGGLGVSTGSGPVSSARGQREGKAPMKLSQREQTLEGRKTAKQIVQFGMALLAKRMEEEELTEQQKQRKAQVQFEAQHYTEEDWDAIRAKLEAKAE